MILYTGATHPCESGHVSRITYESEPEEKKKTPLSICSHCNFRLIGYVWATWMGPTCVIDTVTKKKKYMKTKVNFFPILLIAKNFDFILLVSEKLINYVNYSLCLIVFIRTSLSHTMIDVSHDKSAADSQFFVSSFSFNFIKHEKRYYCEICL